MASRTAADRKKWEELYASGSRPDRPPSQWVLEAVARLPNDGLVADLAGGNGRHARRIAHRDRPVVLGDFVLQAVLTARAANTAILGVVLDATALPFHAGCFDAIIVTNFLDRSIFPALLSLLAPGGHLVYETYTVAHLELVQRGLARGPQSEEYLLRPGELPELVRPLGVVEYWEGETEDEAGRRCCARLVARSAKDEAQSAKRQAQRG